MLEVKQMNSKATLEPSFSRVWKEGAFLGFANNMIEIITSHSN